MSSENRIHIKLESGPLIPSSSPSIEESGNRGAEVLFLGRTRPEDHPEHGKLLALNYECHPTLASAALHTIGFDLLNDHQLEMISIRHAIDYIPVGSASVEIRVLSLHRAQAFTACSQAMNRIKSEVAIWKQECWERAKTWSQSTCPLTTGDLSE